MFTTIDEAGIKEYWIINSVEENPVIYISNEEGKFAGGKMYAGGDVINSTAIQDLQVQVNNIFKN